MNERKAKNRKIKIEYLKEKNKKRNEIFVWRAEKQLTFHKEVCFTSNQVKFVLTTNFNLNLPQNFSTVNHFNILTDVEKDLKPFNTYFTQFKYNITNIIYNITLIHKYNIE